MERKFYFDTKFQIALVGLLLKRFDFLTSVADLIKPDYFEDPVLIWYFQVIRDYYLDYAKVPEDLVIQNELLKAVKSGRIKEESIPRYTEVFKAIHEPVESEDYVISEVIRFCKRQEVRKAFLDCASKTDSEEDGVWDEIISRVQTACTVGDNREGIGSQYFIDFPQRLQQRLLGEEKLVIPTGITELDLQIGGGLKAGQLGVWLGGTGRGKSIALSHCGKRGVVGGFNVLHYTLELDEIDICERYDSSWTRVNINELLNQSSKVEKDLHNLQARYGNKLIVKFYPTGTATIQTLKGHIQQLKALGFIPDLIIVDYLDLLQPLTRYNEEWADLGSIAKDLRGLAGSLKIPIWTGCQSNRAGLSADILDLEHVGDSLRKAQIADVIIAICMSPDERANNAARLFLPKNRNGPAGVVIPIRTAYNRMCFFDPASEPYTAPSKKEIVSPAKRKVDSIKEKVDYAEQVQKAEKIIQETAKEL